MRWKKIGKRISAEGTDITYALPGTGYEVESRKRHIQHANREGTWDHTTYFLIKDGKEVKECWSLKDAKDYAEANL